MLLFLVCVCVYVFYVCLCVSFLLFLWALPDTNKWMGWIALTIELIFSPNRVTERILP